MRSVACLALVLCVLGRPVFAQSDAPVAVAGNARIDPGVADPQVPEPDQFTPQRSQSDVPRRVFLSADVASFHRHAGGERYTLTKAMYGEPAIGTAAYRTPPQASLATPTVNVALSRHLLAGVRVVRAKYESTAGLSLQLPHPFIADRPGTGTLETGPLRRKDVIVDLKATFVTNRGPWTMQISGGPTYFATSQEMVRGMNYRHSLGLNTIAITEVLRETVKGTAWGANSGIDLSYYIWRHLGFGGGAQFNYGHIMFTDEPLTGEPARVSMGTTTLNSGVRVRF